MKQLLLVLGLSLGLAGCATNQGGYTKAKDVEARLKQLTPVEIVNKLGAPTEETEVDSKTKVWTYRTDDNSLTGGKCSVSVTIADQKVTSAALNFRDNSWVSAPLGSCSSIIGRLD